MDHFSGAATKKKGGKNRATEQLRVWQAESLAWPCGGGFSKRDEARSEGPNAVQLLRVAFALVGGIHQNLGIPRVGSFGDRVCPDAALFGGDHVFLVCTVLGSKPVATVFVAAHGGNPLHPVGRGPYK